ncbi:hypothetical protein AB1Y20_021812 [Prymnesium parvum]|uniref:Uncharacterized protein n=1 Tax=Prymnesium parvum TaxID=97485 RepID=A0AB34JMK4_PRYPA
MLQRLQDVKANVGAATANVANATSAPISCVRMVQRSLKAQLKTTQHEVTAIKAEKMVAKNEPKVSVHQVRAEDLLSQLDNIRGRPKSDYFAPSLKRSKRERVGGEAEKGAVAEAAAVHGETRCAGPKKVENLLKQLDEAKARLPPPVEADAPHDAPRHADAAFKADGPRLASGKPVQLCGMHLVINGNEAPRPPSQRPHTASELRRMMTELEESVDPKLVSMTREAAAAAEAQQRASAAEAITVSYVAPPTYAGWIAEKGFPGGEARLTAPKARAQRESERKHAVARLHNKHQLKLKLHDEAQIAKNLFGETTKEKEARLRRAQMLAETTAAHDQRTGVRSFMRHFGRNVFINVIAGGTQVFLVFTVLFHKDGTATLPPRSSAPQSVIIFAMLGVFGCLINIVCLTTIFALIVVQGVQSRTFHAIAKVVVCVLYIGKSSQLFALVSTLLYVPEMFDRILDSIDETDSSTMYIAVIQFGCAVMLLPSVIYAFVSAHKLSRHELALICTRQALQKTYGRNIELHQAICGVAGLIFNLTFYNRAYEIKGDHSLLTLVYVLGGLLAAGVITLALCHRFVLVHLQSYELQASSFEQDKENILQALRLKLKDGNACVVEHCVEKPKLIGLRGNLVGNGVDGSGMVTVLIEGNEYKMQEFQLVPDINPKRKAELEHMTDLKMAELEYRLDKKRHWLVYMMIFYLVASQAYTGVQVVGIASILKWEDPGAVLIYDAIVEKGKEELTSPSPLPALNTSIAPKDCIADILTLTPEQTAACTNVQGILCFMWELCSNNVSQVPNPDFCGSCVIPQGPGQPGRSAFGDLIIGAVIGALVGGLFAVQGSRWSSNGRMRSRTALTCTGFFGAFIAACAGAVCSYLLFAELESNEGRCRHIDLDETTPAVDRLPNRCVQQLGSHYVDDSFSTNARGCLISTAVTAVFFSFESSMLLARKIHEENRNKFGAFVVLISCTYSLIACVIWVGAKIAHDQGVLQPLTDYTNDITATGRRIADQFGRDSPIYFNQTHALDRQTELAGNLWLDSSFVYVVAGAAAIIQVVGIYFATCARSTVWMEGTRVIMIVNSFVMAVFIFVTYLALYAFHVLHNMLGFMIVPSVLGYFYALFFVLQSDIWLIPENLSSIQYWLTLFFRMAPMLLMVCFGLGAALYLAHERVLGASLMALSGAIMLAAMSVFTTLRCNELLDHLMDAVLLARHLRIVQFFFPLVDTNDDFDEKAEQKTESSSTTQRTHSGDHDDEKSSKSSYFSDEVP